MAPRFNIKDLIDTTRKRLDNLLNRVRWECKYPMRLDQSGLDFLCFLYYYHGESEILLFLLYRSSAFHGLNWPGLLTIEVLRKHWNQYQRSRFNNVL